METIGALNGGIVGGGVMEKTAWSGRPREQEELRTVSAANFLENSSQGEEKMGQKNMKAERRFCFFVFLLMERRNRSMFVC